MRDRLLKITAGAPLTPILLLFGLNAVDELDRSAFAILVPTIRDDFGIDNEGILSIISLVFFLALGAQVLVGYWADRLPRVRIVALGATAWTVFTFLTGLAPAVGLLIVARCGSALGRAVNDPTHRSLISDYYPPEARPGVFGIHQAANATGLVLGPALAGVLAQIFGWRAPFLVFWIPSLILVALAARHLREPVRGRFERLAMGADEETAGTEEAPPSLGEGWRICHQVQTLRRVFVALPFLAAALVGLPPVFSILYEDVHGQKEAARGAIAAFAELGALGAIALIGIPLATKMAMRAPGQAMRLCGVVGVVAAAAILGFALSPNVPAAIVGHVIATGAVAVLGPAIYSTLSLAIPPRARALGFSIGSLYVMIGIPALGLVGVIADANGPRVAVAMLVPVFLLGAFLLASAAKFVEADVARVRASTMAQAEVLAARRRGEAKLLLVKDLDVGYDGVQVLFGVDFEVDEGEIVALLGTNGAGKSTLLRAISGLVEPTAGAIVFDGRDATYAPPHEVAARGIVQVPGGKGVFPGLTVAENIRAAGWLFQNDQAYLSEATEQVLTYFPVLRTRWDQPAGNLSGGEQQMLTLGMAFIAKPRLLMIDELSLGLAPIIVEQLLVIVRAIRAKGTTIILVEQSVNVALTVAEEAYFMEKGEIRFKGPTAELLARPDVLRSVFLEGASSGNGSAASNGAAAGNGGATPKKRVSAAAKKAAAAAAIEFADRPAVLQAFGVTRSYGGIQAVGDVTFELKQGQILGVIGPNGAGKTTLFDLLSGFVTPNRGRVLLHGDDVSDLTADARARRGMGRSFQDARLFPALTVAETIALALERKVEIRDPIAAFIGLPAVSESEAAIAERVDELVEMMGVGAFRDKFVAELSTGSRRIVDLACILAHEPSVLLFDEPSSGIAQRETEALGPLLLRIREATDASLLIIEHDMPLITAISDELLALDLGQVVTQGPPQSVIHDDRVVSSYLGSDATVIARSGTVSAPSRRRRKPAASSTRSS